MRRLSLAASLALLSSFMAIPMARAEDGWGLFDVDVSYKGGSWAWTQTVRTDGENTRQIIGGRLAANVGLPAGLHLVGRIDASALQDGGAVAVSFTDPDTFQSLEVYLGAYRNVWKGIGLAGVYGLGFDIEAGGIVPLERYPRTVGVGLRVGDSSGGLWCYTLFGKHEASGPGWKVLKTCQLPVHGRTSLVFDTSIDPKDPFKGRGNFYRGGLAVRLK